MSMKNLYQTNKHYLEILMNIIYAPFPFPKNSFTMQESPPHTPPDMNPPNSFKKLPSHRIRVAL